MRNITDMRECTTGIAGRTDRLFTYLSGMGRICLSDQEWGMPQELRL